MSEEKQKSVTKPSWMPKAAGVAFILIVGVIVAMARAEKTEDTEGPVASDVPSQAEAKDSPVAVAAASYKDGVYSTTGNYAAPSGQESIDVTLTVKDGAITAAAVKANAENPVSKKFQDGFVTGCQMMVVGQKLSDLSLSNVSGSSLTPKGFNDALAEIRTQASV
ncbi:MAG: hypothetical protein WCO25_04685 [Candidatus Uhrbacteria bacterium]